MITGLLLPTLILVALTFAVARMVERFMPETLPGLALQAVISALLLWVLSSLLFAILYTLEAPGAVWLIQSGGWRHFMMLGAQAALVWGPVLALVVSTAPRRWTTAVW